MPDGSHLVFRIGLDPEVLTEPICGAKSDNVTTSHEHAGCWDCQSLITKTLFESLHKRTSAPVPMLLWCPECGERHIDLGEFATKPHHTHACQACGMVWRPAVGPTVGVQYLPGFKNGAGDV